MTLAEIIAFFEQNKDDEAVKNYLAGLSKPTPEGVKEFLETEEGEKLIKPRLDQLFTKGLETWKEKTMPGLIEEEIKKKFPEETEEQKRLRKLEEELTKERKARYQSELKTKATTFATQKGLPVDLVGYFVGQDEETTTSNLTTLETIWQKNLEAAVEAKFKESGRKPHPGGGGGGDDDKKGEFGATLAKKRQEAVKGHKDNQNLYFGG